MKERCDGPIYVVAGQRRCPTKHCWMRFLTFMIQYKVLPRNSASWAEYQVGCLLGVLEKRLTGHAHLCTHR